MALIVAVFILVFGVGTASAQHAAKTKNDAENVNNGQQAASDAAGKLRQVTRDEQAELAALSKNLSRSTEGLQVVTRNDGSKMMDLQDTFQEAVMVRKTTDGKLESGCTNNIEDAKKFLNGDTMEKHAPAVELETK
jgi:small-conductance mechanosensitive channel